MSRDTLMLTEIQRLTGHDTLDGVRMALRRAGITQAGVAIVVGKGAWPPKKTYFMDDVWDGLGERIIQHAAVDADAKAYCWEIFEECIRDSVRALQTGEVFADRLALDS